MRFFDHSGRQSAPERPRSLLRLVFGSWLSSNHQAAATTKPPATPSDHPHPATFLPFPILETITIPVYYTSVGVRFHRGSISGFDFLSKEANSQNIKVDNLSPEDLVFCCSKGVKDSAVYCQYQASLCAKSPVKRADDGSFLPYQPQRCDRLALWQAIIDAEIDSYECLHLKTSFIMNPEDIDDVDPGYRIMKQDMALMTLKRFATLEMKEYAFTKKLLAYINYSSTCIHDPYATFTFRSLVRKEVSCEEILKAVKDGSFVALYVRNVSIPIKLS